MKYVVKSMENLEHIIMETNGNMMRHPIGESARQRDVQRKQMWRHIAEVRRLVKRKPNVKYVAKNMENLEHIITEANGNMMRHHTGESVRQKDVQRKQM